MPRALLSDRRHNGHQTGSRTSDRHSATSPNGMQDFINSILCAMSAPSAGCQLEAATLLGDPTQAAGLAPDPNPKPKLSSKSIFIPKPRQCRQDPVERFVVRPWVQVLRACVSGYAGRPLVMLSYSCAAVCITAGSGALATPARRGMRAPSNASFRAGRKSSMSTTVA